MHKTCNAGYKINETVLGIARLSDMLYFSNTHKRVMGN